MLRREAHWLDREERKHKAQLRRDATAEREEAKQSRRQEFQLPDVKAAVAELLTRPPGLPLDEYAGRILSQHGEDGMTVETLRRIGIRHRRAVEIGCGANGGNAGVLIAGAEFEALLLDGDQELIDMARNVFSGLSATVQCEWISRETVNDTLGRDGFDRDLDYLGIDLDGIDWWIWEALEVRPRMVVCEYNPLFGADVSVTVPYADDFNRANRGETGRFTYPKGYYGASIAAFERLGRRQGYRLVATAPASQNAYFVLDELAGDLPRISPADAWRPITKGKEPTAPDERKLFLLNLIQDEGVHRYFETRGFPLVEVD